MPDVLEAISNKPWSDVTQADYTLEQWHRACLVHLHSGEPTAKGQCKLPVRMPDGTLNRNAVHAAASRIGQTDAPRDEIRAAARRLVSLYRNELEEEPPPRLLALAGMSESARQLSEHVPLAEARATGQRLRIKLIDRGWGSSGYYSEAVLRQAAEDDIFPAGTHMYLDHPTASEDAERPERSVRDLAAVLVTPATYQDGALYGEARVFGPYQQLLAEMADHIGVSIRAAGLVEHGEAEGRTGPIITRLTEGISVDFVTRAGRGGQIVEVLESARTRLSEARSVGTWLESRLHSFFTQLADDMYGEGTLTRDERIGLSTAIGDALSAFVRRIEADNPHLYQRDIYDDPDRGPELADMDESVGKTTPAPPARPEGGHMTNTQPGTPTSGGAPAELSEAELRTALAETKQKLAEAELEIAKLGDNARALEEAKSELAEAKREILRLKANETARAKAIEALEESTLPKTAHERVIEAVTGSNLPLNESGALDEAALVKNIKAAIEAERDYLTRFAEEAGLGTVRGLGTSGAPEVDVERELGAVFQALGMSESAAQVAAKGRG